MFAVEDLTRLVFAVDGYLGEHHGGDHAGVGLLYLEGDDIGGQATGGPCVYKGRDMKVAHAGIGISKAEWDAAFVAMGETLKKLKVPEREQTDLVAILLPLEKDIVEKQ